MKTTKKHTLRHNGVWVATLFALWAAACFAFFNYRYAYHFCYKEQNQLFLWLPSAWAEYLERPHWLAHWLGEMVTQFYYYDYAGALLLTGTLLLLGGAVWALLRQWRSPAWASVVVALLVMTAEAVMHFHLHYVMAGTMVKLLFVGMLLAATLLWRRLRVLALLPVALWLLITVPWRAVYPVGLKEYFSRPTLWKLSMPDFDTERTLAVRTQYERGNDGNVTKMVDACERGQLNGLMLFYYYLSQARRGVLPERLLRYGDVNELGTFWEIGPKAPLPVTRSIHELYWLLGDMTYTERAAMMSCVFAPDNKNVRMLQRLAEVNIVKQDTAAAEKYLRMLRHTWVYRRRANSAWADRRLQTKRAYVNRADTLQTGDNAHRLMMQLLDSNADNRVALDYLLCSDLLLKDMEAFKRDYDRYCAHAPRRPAQRIYQEALCIYMAGSGADEETWRRYVTDRGVMERFGLYNRDRGSRRFADTYWYYFDTHKTPARP